MGVHIFQANPQLLPDMAPVRPPHDPPEVRLVRNVGQWSRFAIPGLLRSPWSDVCSEFGP